MSAENTILGGTPVVEFKDAVEFMSTRATKTCPACGHHKWSVAASTRAASDIGYTMGLVGIELATGEILTHGIPLILATCKKCGYIRTHSLEFISKWIAAGKPEFKEDE